MNHFLSGGEISADSLINTIILASFEMAPHKTYLIVTDSPFIETFLLFTIYDLWNIKYVRTYYIGKISNIPKVRRWYPFMISCWSRLPTLLRQGGPVCDADVCLEAVLVLVNAVAVLACDRWHCQVDTYNVAH